MSRSSLRSQSVCCAASATATYSASHVDSATMSWGEEVQAMGACPAVCIRGLYFGDRLAAFGNGVVGVIVRAQPDG